MNKRKLRKLISRLLNLPKGKYLFLYIKNKFFHFYLKYTKSTKVAYPSTIMLELTNKCNLACTTCPRVYDYGKAMDVGNMNINNAKKVIDEVWPYLDSIGLTGMGETFIYKEILNLVDYIKQKNNGIIISVSTNAVLPGFIDSVRNLVGKIDTIQISIDGLNAVYEEIRRNAKFETLNDNIQILAKLCKNTKTTLMLNMVVTKENYHQMVDLVKYADLVGIDYIDFSMFNLAAVTNIDISYYEFYKSHEFIRAFDQLKTSMTETKNVIVTTHNFLTERNFQKCIFPWSHFYICWNGFVAPCCAKPFPLELNFGNVFENGVLSVLNSKKYQGFRKQWFENKTPNFCNKCHIVSE